ncbi:hypothetical protein MMC26_004320 [Xylographa opegraphella]|nr:hypothetical protein [Xylographa opegraphella]
MVGLMDTTEVVENRGWTLAHQRTDAGFNVLHQKVQLDIDLALRRLKGSTEITIGPLSADLKTLRLNCRQCDLNRLSINGKPSASMTYTDPYKQSRLGWKAGVNQHHMLQERLEGQLRVPPPEPELVINLPKSVRIVELEQDTTLDRAGKASGDPMVVDVTQNTKPAIDQTTRFTPIIISIDFSIDEIRDGIQFVGCNPGDLQYPHAYSQNSLPGAACCLFPCLDAIDSRSTWEISFKCPRTIGDAFRRSTSLRTTSTNGTSAADSQHAEVEQLPSLSDEEEALDLVVICSGVMTDEIIDPRDSSKKTTFFTCTTPVAPQHIGFAIGPFEHVDLAAFRESDEDDKLGQNAVPVHGFCLPGRVDELKNTCLPLAKAIDFFTLTYGSYPFSSYKLCFLEDAMQDCVETASVSLCSTRLLFPEDIIEPLDCVTRQLVYTLACQWSGVNIIPKEPADTWAVVGMAYFITDMFMRKLSGNNEYRYQQKRASDKVCALDVARPSIYDTGKILWLEPSQAEFLAMKSPLVLFILDRRLQKASGSSGFSRIISRVFLNAKVGDMVNGALNTANFQKTCERLGHAKLDVFFTQWVYGAGCPKFRVSQRFNKKRLVVEMLIQQVQGDTQFEVDIDPNTFMRDVKEDLQGIFAGAVQPAFTGPMTIRIHEADGTPYEHIVEIKEALTKFDIPYNTKYKRLKRSRRQKERSTGPAIDFTAENHDDVLLYCLGDVLQTEEEIREWRLSEWSKEEEDKMSQESYEWIRMDADFEWICKMQLNQPGYMYLSQLQQDRDVVAQLESIQFMAASREHPLVSTIFIRTLMDSRYFHGIRTAAATALARLAKNEIGWVGLFHLEKAFQEFFCLPGSKMTRSNEFSDRASYYIQCAIPQAIAQIRDNNGKAPLTARKFLYEKLRYNDNSNNEFSDSHYLATLMKALAESISSAIPQQSETFDFVANDGDELAFFHSCLEEIDRYRRIDEWIPSYHNILSTTALECKRRLMTSGGIPTRAADFLQYTQDGCYSDLRVTAFSCLVELGLTRNDHVLRWFLFVLGTDPSPYVRERLLHLFGKSLGLTAVGEISQPTPASAAPQSTALIVEQESSTQARQDDLARRKTITGALAALRTDIAANTTLQSSLWQAISSPTLTLPQLGALLEICSLLYEPRTSILIVLKYPRYWKCRSHGRTTLPGTTKPSLVLTFSHTSKVRTTLTPKLPPRTAAAPQAPPTPALKRWGSSSSTATAPLRLSIKPPKKPGTPGVPQSAGMLAPATPMEGAKPKLTLKLNVKGSSKGPGPGTPRG